ncbi:hypothetical protein [Actinoplanes utahensis]|uniref:hypothetical protein n=1 Tax=Actinoplanes utahensis TaxID=1869 RepID=UPI0005B92CAF|nr:hypothetical protein [Actinoplanes utahensis]GIF35467.1 hypothetical protein Aut01nite_84530 [Actinoplanes utahensis]
MRPTSSPDPYHRTELASFVAILVVGVLLISTTGVDPTAVAAITQLAAAYLAWRIARVRRPLDEDPHAGPA